MGSIDEILAGYEGLRAAQEAFYQDLHRHPELSHQELPGIAGTVAQTVISREVAPGGYWGIGFTDRATYLAEKDGHLDELPTNHSPKFLPPMQPTLRTGTEALVTAALAWLAP